MRKAVNLKPFPNKENGTEQLPLFGDIWCGPPHDSDLPPFSRKLKLKIKGRFRIKGESMAGEDILPGDEVVVRFTSFCLPGMLCALITPDGFQLKRFRALPNERVLLENSNPMFKDRDFDGNQVVIIGIVTSVLRKAAR